MRRPYLWATIGVAMAFGCTPMTAPAGSSARVEGSWTYVATNSAAPLVVNGSLSITPRSGSSFGGSLDATESGDAAGDRRVVGVVSGRMLDSTLVDFDLTIPDGALRHVGSVRGDSLVGSWVETSGSGIVASGAFRAKRIK